MKKPYLNRIQRESIYLKTTMGACLLFHIEVKKLCREIRKELNKLL